GQRRANAPRPGRAGGAVLPAYGCGSGLPQGSQDLVAQAVGSRTAAMGVHQVLHLLGEVVGVQALLAQVQVATDVVTVTVAELMVQEGVELLQRLLTVVLARRLLAHDDDSSVPDCLLTGRPDESRGRWWWSAVSR